MQLNSSKLFLGILIVLISFSVVHASSDFRILDVTLDRNVFLSGDIVEGTVFIRNRGNETLQYQLELIYNNKVFVQGTPRFVQSGQIAEQKFFWEVPDKSNMWVTFRVYNENNSTTYRKNFLISSRTKDFEFIANNPHEKLRSGDSGTFTFTLYNKGTLNDVYEIFVENWEYYELEKDIIRLESIESTEFSVNVFVPEDRRVGDNKIDVVICNMEDNCKTRTLSLEVYGPEKEQSIVKFDESQSTTIFHETGEPITFNFSVENIGAERKNYIVLLAKDRTDSELIMNVDSSEFSLEVDETGEFKFGLTPLNRTDYKIFLTIRSKGEQVFTREINLIYEPRTHGVLTGMFVGGFQDGDAGRIGLNIIMIFGLISAVYLTYRYFSQQIWREKAINYTEKHPGNLTGYHDRIY